MYIQHLMSHTWPPKYPFKGWGYKFSSFLQLSEYLRWGHHRLVLTKRFPMTITSFKINFWFERYDVLKFLGCHWPMATPFATWHRFSHVIHHGTIVTHVIILWQWHRREMRGYMEYIPRSSWISDLRTFENSYAGPKTSSKTQSLEVSFHSRIYGGVLSTLRIDGLYLSALKTWFILDRGGVPTPNSQPIPQCHVELSRHTTWQWCARDHPIRDGNYNKGTLALRCLPRPHISSNLLESQSSRLPKRVPQAYLWE